MVKPCNYIRVAVCLVFLNVMTCMIAHHTQYCANIKWTIYVFNQRDYPIALIVKNDTILDEWERPERIDYNYQNSINIQSMTKESIGIELQQSIADGEPKVTESSEFLFHVQVDSSHYTIESIAINPYPLPKYKDYTLCSEYYIADDDGFFDYICEKELVDTIVIYKDSIYSTIEYYLWNRYKKDQ